MKSFGKLIRKERGEQGIGLREMARAIGISPAYLSRIERCKEPPPRPEIIKKIAAALALDPDVLFRLSSSTDPEIVDFLNKQPEAMKLIRLLKDSRITSEEYSRLYEAIKNLKPTP